MSGTSNKYIYILSAELRLYGVEGGIYKWRQNIMCLSNDQFAFIYLWLSYDMFQDMLNIGNIKFVRIDIFTM